MFLWKYQVSWGGVTFWPKHFFMRADVNLYFWQWMFFSKMIKEIVLPLQLDSVFESWTFFNQWLLCFKLSNGRVCPTNLQILRNLYFTCLWILSNNYEICNFWSHCRFFFTTGCSASDGAYKKLNSVILISASSPVLVLMIVCSVFWTLFGRITR